METKGIDNKKLFLENLFMIQLPIFEKTIEVFSSDDKLNSVLIGYEKKNYKSFKTLILNLMASPRVFRALGKKDFNTYSANLKSALTVIDLKWQKEFIKGNYYYIKAIAIANEERGRGIFRKLITPTLSYCNENNLPLILESNNQSNIPIYEHFGFKLVKTIEKEGIDLKQYCFIKYPCRII
ncbi:GNAT family N-acetyltransferase [Clostridiaceae bacterium UIB06]|uniref:GNAT family N-acetyltransferase n=1 Tax=Clostridium thailandense TaxID=2794346 RepID=A0A949WQR9_9CLOT|nr:GNAT family N-acetyltransferase [Clostridium thailandense]MBV7273110.1 GNAT family N-acetyltransferase [Clostridium thailandense]MCH5135774.1 GNAT family N-acetyltransferase [Clostridiaceae bacterium UIB06]